MNLFIEKAELEIMEVTKLPFQFSPAFSNFFLHQELFGHLFLIPNTRTCFSNS